METNMRTNTGRDNTCAHDREMCLSLANTVAQTVNT